MATEKRLIDANALWKAILAESWKQIRIVQLTLDFIKIIIDEQPTVDAVEVVHGRWIHVPSSDMMTGKAYKCSECNKMRYGSFMPNYCSNCGANMMDGDADA